MVGEGSLRNGKWKIGPEAERSVARNKQESPKGVSESCTDFYGNEEAKEER